VPLFGKAIGARHPELTISSRLAGLESRDRRIILIVEL
jgi:hypothetical protein